MMFLGLILVLDKYLYDSHDSFCIRKFMYPSRRPPNFMTGLCPVFENERFENRNVIFKLAVFGKFQLKIHILEGICVRKNTIMLQGCTIGFPTTF